jgi:hypothetical protein
MNTLRHDQHRGQSTIRITVRSRRSIGCEEHAGDRIMPGSASVEKSDTQDGRRCQQVRDIRTVATCITTPGSNPGTTRQTLFCSGSWRAINACRLQPMNDACMDLPQ